jgi:hypothetical protein
MTNRQRTDAAYYALLLRTRGESPSAAAQAVVRRYPALEPELRRAGLLAHAIGEERTIDAWEKTK